MVVPVGHQWQLLLDLEDSRLVVADILGLNPTPRQSSEEKPYFVELAGSILINGPWPADAKMRATAYAHKWISALFHEQCKPCVGPWDQLAEDLPKDPDFRAYVFKAAHSWLDRSDWRGQLSYVIQAFAFEGMITTVEYGGEWHREKLKQTGLGTLTWITRIKGERGNKPIIRLVLRLNGRSPSEAEKGRGGYCEKTVGDPVASERILNGPHKGSNDPLNGCVRQEEDDLIKRTIKDMPEVLRKVFLMHYEQGQTFDEISEILGISVKKVRKHFNKVRNWLRDRFNPPQAS